MPELPEPTSNEQVSVSMQRLSLTAAAAIASILGLLILIYVLASARSNNIRRGSVEQPLSARRDSPGKQLTHPRAPNPVQTADLKGHYEALGKGEQRARMCMVSHSPRVASVGIVTENSNGPCAGAGEAVRKADRLSLTMAGDGECTIRAHIAGTKVTFPRVIPKGCAYYCAPGASLAGEAFEKIGGKAADAERALDLVGDPLCG
jgi:hypothetical protein